MKKLIAFFKKLFKKNFPVSNIQLADEPAFYDDFSNGIDQDKWIISEWEAPGKNRHHYGYFNRYHVTHFSGKNYNAIGLLLKQEKGASFGDCVSIGAEIATKEKFGYGAYEFVVRASSTAATPEETGKQVSGSVTGIFNYASKSETEIDFEVEGNQRYHFIHATSWMFDDKPNEHTEQYFDINPASEFLTYKFIWIPGKIEYYVNNKLIAVHTKVVPSKPAAIMLNHWGTHDYDWGGIATPDVTRYMWIKSVKYTPLKQS